jgi:cytidine deaminase
LISEEPDLMRTLGITTADEELVDIASQLLLERFSEGRHHVAAALRLPDGSVVTGVHIGSRRIDICAEQIALGVVLSTGRPVPIACASVIMMHVDDIPIVTSPCGVCRELLNYYNPDLTVLVDDAGKIVKTSMSELLPAPWLLPAETKHRMI